MKQNEKLIQWIKKNLLDKNGNPQGRIFSLKKKKNIEECNQILNLTSFLNKNCSISERIYCITYNINKNILCKNKNCNNHVSFNNYNYGYSKYCSSKCGINDNEVYSKIKNTCLKRYGTTSPLSSKIIQNKIKETCLKKYGVENIFQSSKIKDEIKKTNINNTGFEYPMQCIDIKNKSINTLLKKYSVNHNSKIKHVIEKRKKTSLQKYGVINPAKSDIIKNKTKEVNLQKYGVEYSNQKHIDKKSLELLNNKEWLINQHHKLKNNCVEISKILNVYYGTVINYLNKHGIELKNYFSSSYEKEIAKFINIENIETNSKNIIPPYEIDIYLPEYKLAIEFNGLYWHSNKDKNYHLSKTELCNKQNIQLLHIFENEWTDPIKQDIWKSIINNKLGRDNKIFARKCKIKEVDNNLTREFLNNNHLQGYCSSSVKLGLFYNNELISLMTFGKTRFSKKYEWEIIRFCNKKFFTIVGGASKLYKYFIDNYNPRSIISYADRRYSNGSLYEKLGFKFSHYSKPNYWYFRNNTLDLHSRVKFQKHKLKNLLESFDPSKSEIENMTNNGYLRIFDCGNIISFYQT